MSSYRHRLAWQLKPIAPALIKSWLIERASLTALIQANHADFSVRNLRQGLARVHHDELFVLKIGHRQLAHSREVLLLGQGTTLVYAHSVIAKQGLRGYWHWLKRLGSKSLGAYLFANPKIKRSQIAYKKLSLRHPLAIKARKHTQQSEVWARRSTFKLAGIAILVTEVMLAPLFDEPPHYFVTRSSNVR